MALPSVVMHPAPTARKHWTLAFLDRTIHVLRITDIATYSYYFADLRTNAILAELPLTRVNFDSQLNAIGGFKGSLPLGDAGVLKLDPIGSTQTERTAIYVDRDGTIVWGGILWTRVYNSSTHALDLGGSEFLSYFQRRNVNAVFDANNIDQMDLARQVATYVASVTGGDIGITASSGTSPQMRTLHYDPWDLKNAYSILSETSALEFGYDFAVDVQYVAGVPTKTLTLSYPRRGRNWLATGHLFEYPGNIQSYVWTEDGTQGANKVYVTGSGSGPNQLISTAADTSLIDAGYPLLEAVIPSKSIDNQYYLDSQARAHLTALANPVVIPEITVRGDLDPIFGSYSVGDDGRIRITDERFPAPVAGGAGIDTYRRIIGQNVTPGEGGIPEVIVLPLGNPV